MTRIISGSVGGRSISVPPKGTRPTSDRVREALFTKLEHEGLIEGARVLDLYAGSGALGLEAASRGAEQVDLVECDRRAAQVCRDNARSLALTRVRVHQAKVEAFLARDGIGDVDLAFVDPPYDLAEDRLAQVLDALVSHLATEAVVVVERSSRSPEPALPPALSLWQSRTYGETVLHLVEFDGDAPLPGDALDPRAEPGPAHPTA